MTMATAHWQPATPVRDAGLEAARILLLLQGGLALLATVEAGFWVVASGPPLLAVGVALSATGAVAALVLAARIGHGSRAARRLVIAMELAVLAVAMVDVLLTLVIGRSSMDLMPIVTRILIPVAVLGLVGQRRPTGGRGR